MKRSDIDYKKFVKDKDLTSMDKIADTLKDMFKDVLQAALDGEFGEHMGRGPYELSKDGNHRNGSNPKQLSSSVGKFEISSPRDRNGTFQPEIINDCGSDISNLEEKIIHMYARGTSTREIAEVIHEIYGVSVSATMVSNITNKVIHVAQKWQTRPLETVYPFVFLDAIHYSVREDGRVKKKAVYTVLGIDCDGIKDILGVYIGENESAKFWMTVLTDLNNRGLQDIFFVSVDGLTGFSKAIEAVYPKANIQRCIVHQIRNSLRWISYKERKEFALDLKEIYRAVTMEAGYKALQGMKEKWGSKYGVALKGWEDNWQELSTYFDYNAEIKTVMYTTNPIESVHRQFRKVTKTKGAFPSDEALNKLLYLCIQGIGKKWTKPINNWPEIKRHLAVVFEDRMKV